MKRTALFLLLMLALDSSASGQGLIKKYQSAQRIVIIGDVITPLIGSYATRMDFDGDGTPELAIKRTDEANNLTYLAILGTVDRDAGTMMGWELETDDLDALGLRGPYELIGFYDFNGDGTKEAVFRGIGTVKQLLIQDVLDGTANTLFVFPQQARDAPSGEGLRFAVFDVDRDQRPDLIVSDPATQTVQVWGVETTGTATEEAIEAALMRHSENYPNPFRASTTITYEVEQPGSVTLTVYDAMGREVTTLVDAQQSAGRHAVVWDGRDDGGQAVASGVYFYRLRVRDAVMSRQTIRVK